MRSQTLIGAAAGIVLASAFMLTGCFESPNGSNGGPGDTTLVVPENYTFIGSDSLNNVDIGGQVVRNLLIADIQTVARLGSTGGSAATPITAADILKYYVHADADSLAIRANLNGKTPLHAKYAQIASAKSLHDKVSSATVIGYGVPTDSLVRRWAAQIAANAQNPAWRGTNAVHVDTNDVDLSQMISKLLAGAVAYHQATGFYLANIASKNNTAVVSGKNYTEMEHNWDEAFGYFGAARNYTSYHDDSLNSAAASFRDDNGDTRIDFRSEYNFNMMARYTARRDRFVTGQDWNGDIFKAFRRGRALITGKRGNDAIAAERAIIADIWERAFAANTISYIRNVKIILDTVKSSPTTEVNARTALAGNWAELKTFSLALQFNPYKKATDAQLAQLQGWIGTRPVRDTTAGRKAAYVAKLDSAFVLLKTIYGFSDAQVTSAGWR